MDTALLAGDPISRIDRPPTGRTGLRPLTIHRFGDRERLRAALSTFRPLTESWHVISGEHLLELLRRVAKGEDPDLVYLEAYVNADREDYRE